MPKRKISVEEECTSLRKRAHIVKNKSCPQVHHAARDRQARSDPGSHHCTRELGALASGVARCGCSREAEAKRELSFESVQQLKRCERFCDRCQQFGPAHMRRQLALGWLHQSVHLQRRFARGGPWLVGACCLVQIPAQSYQRARPTPKYKVEPPPFDRLLHGYGRGLQRDRRVSLLASMQERIAGADTRQEAGERRR